MAVIKTQFCVKEKISHFTEKTNVRSSTFTVANQEKWQSYFSYLRICIYIYILKKNTYLNQSGKLPAL